MCNIYMVWIWVQFILHWLQNWALIVPLQSALIQLFAVVIGKEMDINTGESQSVHAVALVIARGYGKGI